MQVDQAPASVPASTPPPDVQILGHLKGIYESTSPKMVFDTQERWERFWMRVVSTTISPPSFDFKDRDIYVLCGEINTTSSNYIGAINIRKDSNTKEYYVYCCNVVEEISKTAMGKCKLVLSVKRDIKKLNVIWLDPCSPNIHDQKLAAYAARLKLYNDQIDNLRMIIGRTKDFDYRCDLRVEEASVQQYKIEVADLIESIRAERIPVKEKLAGKPLN